MQNKIRNKTILVLIFGIFLSLVIACGGGQPAPPKYQGNWVGDDGSTLYMNADGKAGFVMGSKNVTGGSAEFDDAAKTLTISLFGISHTWKIDQEPNDKGEMRLDGKTYRKK
jgi:hypothetical protein